MLQASVTHATTKLTRLKNSGADGGIGISSSVPVSDSNASGWIIEKLRFKSCDFVPVARTNFERIISTRRHGAGNRPGPLLPPRAVPVPDARVRPAAGYQ
jgi:hypothetical protein